MLCSRHGTSLRTGCRNSLLGLCSLCGKQDQHEDELLTCFCFTALPECPGSADTPGGSPSTSEHDLDETSCRAAPESRHWKRLCRTLYVLNISCAPRAPHQLQHSTKERHRASSAHCSPGTCLLIKLQGRANPGVVLFSLSLKLKELKLFTLGLP